MRHAIAMFRAYTTSHEDSFGFFTCGMIAFRDRTGSLHYEQSSASRESVESRPREAGRPPPAALGHALVLRFVELTLDPCADVPRPLHLSQTLVEHEFGDASCRCDFRFQNVVLARK